MTPTAMIDDLWAMLATAERINEAIGPHVQGDPSHRREAMWLAHVHSGGICRSIKDTIRYLETVRHERTEAP